VSGIRNDVLYWSSVGNLDQVKKAVARGHGINYADEAGYTPLHAAAENGHLEVVEHLLLLGADRSATDTAGMRPVDYARGKANGPLIKLLERNLNAGGPI
jgi:ankyrin repeat protein